LNNLAWLLATCADAKIRNGKKALEYATRLCALSEWKDATGMDTLAASYAECGQFKEAIQWQKRVLDLASANQKAESDNLHKKLLDSASLNGDAEHQEQEASSAGKWISPLQKADWEARLKLYEQHKPYHRNK
jgi:hypothetical protein